MKYKIFVGIGSIIIMLIIVLIWWLYYMERVESYEETVMKMVDEFCNNNYGEEWSLDSIFRYNDKISFAVVIVNGNKVSFSVQPTINTIIIENVKGNLDIKKRVHYLGKLKKKKQDNQQK